jgi:hypothetical protein
MSRLMNARLSVSAPVPETFRLLADVENETEWNPDVKRVRRLTDGPLGVGTEWEGDYRGMGAMRIRLVDYDPDRRLTFRTTGSRLDMVFTFDFSARADGGTDADAHAELTPKGATRLMAPLMVPMMRRTFAKRPAQLEEGLRRMRERTPG